MKSKQTRCICWKNHTVLVDLQNFGQIATYRQGIGECSFIDRRKNT